MPVCLNFEKTKFNHKVTVISVGFLHCKCIFYCTHLSAGGVLLCDCVKILFQQHFSQWFSMFFWLLAWANYYTSICKPIISLWHVSVYGQQKWLRELRIGVKRLMHMHVPSFQISKVVNTWIWNYFWKYRACNKYYSIRTFKTGNKQVI